MQVGGQRRKPLLQAGALRVAGRGPPGVPRAAGVPAAHAPCIQCLAPPASRHQAMQCGTRAYHAICLACGCSHAQTPWGNVLDAEIWRLRQCVKMVRLQQPIISWETLNPSPKSATHQQPPAVEPAAQQPRRAGYQAGQRAGDARVCNPRVAALRAHVSERGAQRLHLAPQLPYLLPPKKGFELQDEGKPRLGSPGSVQDP